MREALPYAIGVAISPVPIAAILLLLTCRKAVANGFSFLAGWLVGVAVPALLFVVLVNEANLTDSDPEWIAIAELTLGIAFLLASALVWRRRHRRSELDAAWVAAVDSFTTLRSAGLGIVLSGANPKVVALSLGAAFALAEADVNATMTAAAVALFSAIGATGVLAPLAIYVAAPSRAGSLLQRLRGWLGRHETAVLVVLGLLIGALFISDGLDSL